MESSNSTDESAGLIIVAEKKAANSLYVFFFRKNLYKY